MPKTLRECHAVALARQIADHEPARSASIAQRFASLSDEIARLILLRGSGELF